MHPGATEVSWGRAPICCCDVFLDPNLPYARAPRAAPSTSRPPCKGRAGVAELWFLAQGTLQGPLPWQSGGRQRHPHHHPHGLCAAWGNAKCLRGWDFPGVPVSSVSGPKLQAWGHGLSPAVSRGAGVGPDLSAVSSSLRASPRFRKRTGISDCKACWTPP